VKASLPAKDLKELIVWLRANPNKPSAGVATVGYLAMMSFGVPAGAQRANQPEK
jgi:hypothetical protein